VMTRPRMAASARALGCEVATLRLGSSGPATGLNSAGRPRPAIPD
jgi:hypothetical protein